MAKFAYDSTKNADLFYAIKVPVLDPFFFIDLGQAKYVFLDHRELGFFQEKNKNPNLQAVLLKPSGSFEDFAWQLLEQYGLGQGELEVPFNFPLQLADFLRSKGIELSVQESLYPERAIKTTEEVQAIRQSVQKTEKAFALIERILRESTIQENSILYNEEVLTSEFLKSEAEKLLLKEDMISEEGIIISCGQHAAIPHHPGEGGLKPHQTIVCDLFPRSRTTGYFADITRTFVKGAPPEEIQKMYEAVLLAQQEGIKAVALGKKASDIHKVCIDVLLQAGYHVGDKGFVHNTGHGLGLEVHENPRLGEKSEETLEPGNVVTIEPGLYYPERGIGIRIEDDILVTAQGAENLVSYPKGWVIP